MTTQNNLTLFTGDGPISINFGVLQDGLPFNLSLANNVIIVLKGGSDQPDPTNPFAANYFSVSDGVGPNGIVITNPVAGLGTWTILAAFLAEPATLWWHGTILIQGAVFTWGFGSITVSAV